MFGFELKKGNAGANTAYFIDLQQISMPLQRYPILKALTNYLKSNRLLKEINYFN